MANPLAPKHRSVRNTALVMFPVLVLMYVRLAIAEERDSEKAFCDRWLKYAAATQRFIPSFTKDDRARSVNSH